MSDTFYLLSDGPFHTIIESEDEFVKVKFTGEKLWIGDDYHKMNELYDHRMMLFVALLIKLKRDLFVFKSKLHYDGTMFGPDWFIAGIEHKGKAWLTYHLKVDPYWNLLDCSEIEKAPEWDGHTSADVLERLKLI